jgi:hypothetical protein
MGTAYWDHGYWDHSANGIKLTHIGQDAKVSQWHTLYSGSRLM